MTPRIRVAHPWAFGSFSNADLNRFCRMLGLVLLSFGEDHNRIRPRRHPGLGMEGNRSPGFAFGYQNAVKAQIENLYPMRQAPNFERHPAQEPLTAFDVHRQFRNPAGLEIDFG